MKKIIVSLIIIIAALCGGGYYYVWSVLQGKDLKTLVASQIEEKLGRKTTIKSIELGLFSGILVKGLKISGNPEFGEYNQISAGSMSVHPDLGALLSGKVVLSSATLSSPSIEIRRKASGAKDYEDIEARNRQEKKTESKKSDVELSIQSFAINEGKLFFKDELEKRNISVNSMNLSGTFPGEGTFSIKGRLMVGEEGKEQPITLDFPRLNLGKDSTYARGVVTAENFNLTLLNGTMGASAPPEFRSGTATVNTNIEYDASSKSLTTKTELAISDLDLIRTDGKSKIEISTNSSAMELSLELKNIGDTEKSQAGSWSVKSQMNSVILKADGRQFPPVSLEIQADPSATVIRQISTNGKWGNLNLNGNLPALQAFIPNLAAISPKIKGDLQSNFDLSLNILKGSELKSLITNLGMTDFASKKEASLLTCLDGSTVKCSWKGNGAALALSALSGTPPQGLTASFDIPAVAISALQPFVPADTAASFAPVLSGKAALQGSLSMEKAGPVLKALLNFEKVGFTSTRFTLPLSLTGSLNLDGKNLKSTAARINIGSSVVNLNLSILFPSEPGLLITGNKMDAHKTRIELLFDSSALILRDLNDSGILPPTFITSGTAAMEKGSLKGTSDSLVGNVTITLAQGELQLYGREKNGSLSKIPLTIPISSLSAPLGFDKGVLVITKAEAAVCSRTGKVNSSISNFSADLLNPPGSFKARIDWTDLSVEALLSSNPWIKHAMKGDTSGYLELGGTMDGGTSSLIGTGTAKATGGEWAFGGKLSDTLSSLKSDKGFGPVITQAVPDLAKVLEKVNRYGSLIASSAYSEISTIQPIELKNGIFSFPNVTANTSGGKIMAKGSCDITGKETQFDFTVDMGTIDLKSPEFGGLSAKLTSMGIEDTTLPVTVRASGTPLEPKISFGNSLVDTLEKTLRKGLEKKATDKLKNTLFGKILGKDSSSSAPQPGTAENSSSTSAEPTVSIPGAPSTATTPTPATPAADPAATPAPSTPAPQQPEPSKKPEDMLKDAIKDKVKGKLLNLFK
ncbi:MAG: hypothetical protein CVV64_07350 [Candidatus Wallbacteria bacterium HGW-Wallbacteria-1]|jgi:hypothetical protein|uniref:AsmA-like C-terminal domain-containing protein n=1 Tax=Candidatus Wallbacteria bacterium HGW-Wallbacteria-1 TaxID=2013854 RepID=A0A2N1PQT4_9BACT|nr:MAG: hypothetical protein CVV64_07350 [Candidatus Wallbacteria bacterium HGW-Wallbacteria-1]